MSYILLAKLVKDFVNRYGGSIALFSKINAAYTEQKEINHWLCRRGSSVGTAR
jgi:type VI protein secretion system component VasA